MLYPSGIKKSNISVIGRRGLQMNTLAERVVLWRMVQIPVIEQKKQGSGVSSGTELWAEGPPITQGFQKPLIKE